ncbi:MAG: helix-turn-helix transcriptional regulator [Clostridia bacterium]|nr:helix-turn-helix transcriptional regulator [Clostridia bacterium]
MKTRKQPHGTCNMVGANIEKLRKEKNLSQKDFIAKLQAFGLDINPTSYSKLEGQIRCATDKELFAVSQVLGVTVNDLF